jgi:hypothetical protein
MSGSAGPRRRRLGLSRNARKPLVALLSDKEEQRNKKPGSEMANLTPGFSISIW